MKDGDVRDRTEIGFLDVLPQRTKEKINIEASLG